MNWYVPNLKTNFISGHTYFKMCKWSICPRYNQSFIPNEILEDDLVFLNLDYVNNLVNFLRKNTIKNKFRLITQNSDRDFTKDIFLNLKDYCNKIYAINSTCDDDIIVKIPIGINDQSTEFLDNQDFTFKSKENLIYMNFRTGHHPSRRMCFDYFNQFDWVTITNENNYMPVNDFYEKLKTFKYCISPRGAGIDTHRMYESLLFGVIPILKSSEIDDLHREFPVIIVNDWNEIDYNFLNDNYEYYLDKYFNWINNNKNWYLPDFWIK